jgi:hypothetical protein
MAATVRVQHSRGRRRRALASEVLGIECECCGRSAWGPSKQYCYAFYTATVSGINRKIRAIEGREIQLDINSESVDEVSSVSDEESSIATRLPLGNFAALIRSLYGYNDDNGITADMEVPSGSVFITPGGTKPKGP